MGQDPGELRQEIENTRARVGDEVEALSYKTDVGARVGDYVHEKKEAVKSTVSRAVPSRDGVSRRFRGTKRAAESNPLGITLAAVGVGFVVGLLVPSSRFEDEQIGEAADRVKDAARQTGQEALQRGKDVAQEATRSAVEGAKESGSEHASELAETLQNRVEQESSQAT